MRRLLLLITICISSVSFGQTNNYSISFDGVDDYVDFGNPSTFEFENTDFSVSFWIKTNNLAYQFLIGNYNGNGQYPTWSIGLRPSGVIFNDLRTPGFTEDGVTNVCDGNWHYLSFSRSGDSFKYYIDGNLEMDVTHLLTNGDVSDGNNLIIGKANVLNNSFYNGEFDLLEIWNKTLTQQEIQQYMNCPPTVNETGLVGYWDFEEGNGTITNDQTSNANDGILNGGVTWSTDVPPSNCNVGITELNSNQTKELIKIVNLLGQEVEYTPNTALIYQYSDGTSEKVFTIED